MIGQRLGSYAIERKIGEGGMGAVYIGEHATLQRRAAIKVLLPELSRNAEIVERFVAEARAAAAVKHPGVIEIYDVGTHDDGSLYIVMELLEGESLAQRLRAGALSLGSALQLARQVATTLQVVHERGIVHRDLKPDNVFLIKDPEVAGGERAKILDFGIAKLARASQVNRTSGPMGTAAYMAPEQWRAEVTTDARADIYSLGCMIFELVAGSSPFAGDLYQMMDAHMHHAPPRLATAAPGTPAALDALVARMLAKAPAERPASMAEITAALAAMPDRAIAAPNRSTPPPNLSQAAPTALVTGPAAPASSRKPMIVAIAVLAVAGVAVAGFALTRDPDAESPAASRPPAAADAAARIAIDAGPLAPPGMVLIPAATFQRGSDAAEIDRAFAWCQQLTEGCRRDIYEREQPTHPVELSAFYLDRRERSVEEVVRWLAAATDTRVDGDRVLDATGGVLVVLGAGSLVADRGAVRASAEAAVLPATGVTHRGARAFCASLGGDLPTEAQWELAARGSTGRRFPWGAEPAACEAAVFDRGTSRPCASAGSAGPVPVAADTGDLTPDGIAHLGGNVSEWVRDDFADRYPACPAPCRDPVAATGTSPQVVVRGGNYALPAEATRAAGRSRGKRDAGIANIGFRCSLPRR